MGIALSLLVAASLQAPAFALGHTPSPDRLKAIDIEVTPDGRGLAPGNGSAAAGKVKLKVAVMSVVPSECWSSFTRSNVWGVLNARSIEKKAENMFVMVGLPELVTL